MTKKSNRVAPKSSSMPSDAENAQQEVDDARALAAGHEAAQQKIDAARKQQDVDTPEALEAGEAKNPTKKNRICNKRNLCVLVIGLGAVAALVIYASTVGFNNSPQNANTPPPEGISSNEVATSTSPPFELASTLASTLVSTFTSTDTSTFTSTLTTTASSTDTSTGTSTPTR